MSLPEAQTIVTNTLALKLDIKVEKAQLPCNHQ